jgi:lysophospholipase L1-like esterase
MTVLAALLLTGACGGDEPRDGRVDTMVTLGDSFTSGAGIPTIDTSNGCQRSDHDYGALAAKQLKAKYVDVSCGSATTANATTPQVTAVGPVPPQLKGVTKKADVVTVGLGLNDLQFFTDMVFTCTRLAAVQPQGTPCQDLFKLSPSGGPIDRLPQIAQNITAVLSAVEERAPDAQVLMVGVPQLVPESGTCPELPLPAEEYPYFHEAFDKLADTMKDAADDAGVTFIDVLGPSEGHDICAGDDAWVLGSADRPNAGIAYHPLVVEQRAVADLVVDAVRD